MRSSKDRILVSHAGNLPRPDYLDNLIDGGKRTEGAKGTNYGALLPKGVQYIVDKQIEHGVDIVNDGETDASEWVNARQAWDEIVPMNVPFGLAQGNHDHDNWGGHPSPIPDSWTATGTDFYNTYFGPGSKLLSSGYTKNSWSVQK